MTDIHRQRAAATLGIHPDQVTRAQRLAAKAENLGLMYGGLLKERDHMSTTTFKPYGNFNDGRGYVPVFKTTTYETREAAEAAAARKKPAKVLVITLREKRKAKVRTAAN